MSPTRDSFINALLSQERYSPERIAHEALKHGFEDFKAALEPNVGDLVKYTLWVPPDWVLKGPEKIVGIKRDPSTRFARSGQGRITHVKLADSPCWVPIANLVR